MSKQKTPPSKRCTNAPSGKLRSTPGGLAQMRIASELVGAGARVLQQKTFLKPKALPRGRRESKADDSLSNAMRTQTRMSSFEIGKKWSALPKSFQDNYLAQRIACKYIWPGSNWRPSACEADIIATRPQMRWGPVFAPKYFVMKTRSGYKATISLQWGSNPRPPAY